MYEKRKKGKNGEIKEKYSKLVMKGGSNSCMKMERERDEGSNKERYKEKGKIKV